MREFVFGELEQYKALGSELCQGKKYKFENRKLPINCCPDTATLWFAKIKGIYYVFIDTGITTDIMDAAFREFLANGEIKFQNTDAMMQFFHSFQYLYGKEKMEDAGIDENYRPVIDREKLREITESEKLPSSFCAGERSGIITHGLFDGNKSCVCWDAYVATLKDMQAISRVWADRIQEYIATGKRFGQ